MRTDGKGGEVCTGVVYEGQRARSSREAWVGDVKGERVVQMAEKEMKLC